MPLAWAHAEFLKLLVARDKKRPLELLDAVWERYQGEPPRALIWYWRDDAPFAALPAGRALVIESREPFLLHFGFDGWQEIEDRASAPMGLGMHVARIEHAELEPRHVLTFTRFNSEAGRWECIDHTRAHRQGSR